MVCRRWGKNGIQDSGFRGVAQFPSRRAGDLRLFKGRSQESGIRMKSICLPPSAFCLLPTDTVGGMS